MALDATALSAEIKAIMQSYGFQIPSSGNQGGGLNDKFIDAISEGIVAHIKANAVVAGVDSVGGAINGTVS